MSTSVKASKSTATPFCKDPSRRGTRQLELTSLVVSGQGSSKSLALDEKLYLSISTDSNTRGDGIREATNITLDGPVAKSLFAAMNIELEEMDPAHVPHPTRTTEELSETRELLKRAGIEGPRLLNPTSVGLVLRQSLIDSLSINYVRRAARLLIKARPDLIDTILESLITTVE